MQAALEGPSIAQGRLEAPQAHLYAYTNADAIASTSNVVKGQISLLGVDVYNCLILVLRILLYLRS